MIHSLTWTSVELLLTRSLPAVHCWSCYTSFWTGDWRLSFQCDFFRFTFGASAGSARVKQQERNCSGYSYVNSFNQNWWTNRALCGIKLVKRLPTKWCNVGTDWSLVKGFDINFIIVPFLSEQRQRPRVFFCFYHKVERVYRLALRADETFATTKSTCIPNR